MTYALGLKYALKDQGDKLHYWWLRRHHRPLFPLSIDADQVAADALHTYGGHISSLDVLALPESPAMVSAADKLLAQMVNRAPVKGGFCISARQDEIDEFPELIRWGLNERLLAIVENYIGLPIEYRGLTVRRDQKGGEQTETRLWHRDAEDQRIIKIIVYLNDVDRAGGAYEYISRVDAPPTWRAGPMGGRIDEKAMARLVPTTAWRHCGGPRGTVVFTDTCSVYHRGSVPEAEDRLALFFCYNSRTPRMPQFCAPLFDRERFVRAAKDLSRGQRVVIGF